MQLIRMSQIGVLALVTACTTKKSEIDAPEIQDSPEESVIAEQASQEIPLIVDVNELENQKWETAQNPAAGEGAKAKKEEKPKKEAKK